MNLIEQYVRMLLESDDEKILDTDSNSDDDDEKQNEFSGAGAVAGYSLPLGMDPQAPKQPKVKSGKKRSAWKAASSAFGNAKLVK